MANYAYLRVSTHTQDVENQKLSVLDYCNSQGIASIEFVEDTTSGRRSWRDREIGRLLETADAGDVLVAAEVSRLARSTLQVLELLQAATLLGRVVGSDFLRKPECLWHEASKIVVQELFDSGNPIALLPEPDVVLRNFLVQSSFGVEPAATRG